LAGFLIAGRTTTKDPFDPGTAPLTRIIFSDSRTCMTCKFCTVTARPRDGGHTHVFPDPARSRTIANGAIPPVCLGTVRCTLPMHVVFLHHPLESFAFRAADHIDEVARLKIA